MDTRMYEACAKVVTASYMNQAQGAFNAFSSSTSELIEKKKIPEHGWPEERIERLLNDLSDMDSNNFPSNCGVGEREGRIASSLVKRRHFRLSHGIGRSGDITATQPKAAGSSIINVLANRLTLDSIKIAGVPSCNSCFIVPMATGMALTLCILHLKNQRPNAKYVIWPRIDQKSCFKAIGVAGCEPIVIENQLIGDQLQTNSAAIEQEITTLGSENIVCVMTTTSCFAPRSVDRLEEVAKLCEKFEVPHLVNNAYGVQSSKCMHVIQQAHKSGRLDVFVQSADKNYMVPVGGAVIAGFDKVLIESISKSYPGRASATPSIDVLITLLSLGVSGYKKMLSDRKDLYGKLKERVSQIVVEYGERMLETPHNPISIAFTLSKVGASRENVSEIGSMLFLRNVSGMRVVTGLDTKEINGHQFEGFGSHHNSYPEPYFTVAAAIGMTEEDLEFFCQRLRRVLDKVSSR